MPPLSTPSRCLTVCAIKEEWTGNLPAPWNGSFGRIEYYFKYMTAVLQWAAGLKVLSVWCLLFMTPH